MDKSLLTNALFLMGCIGQTYAATWYVAPNGSDGNNCSTATSACGSLNGAYQKTIGGDTIQLAGGSYGNQSLTSRSPASDIIVQPASGASVTLASLEIKGATRLDIRDITTRNFTVQMNSRYVTLRNVTIAGGLFYLGGSDITMIGGSVGPGVDYHPQIAPASGWQGQGNNFVFDGVWFHDWTRTNSGVHTECLQVAGTTNMIIRNSKFTNCAVFDLSYTSYNNAGHVTNLLLENNFFDAAVSGGYFSVHFSAMSGGTVRFNSAKQAMFVDTTYPNTGTLNVIGNNIQGGLVDGLSGGCLGTAMAGAYSYNVTQGVKCGATDVNAAPGFVNAGSMDLRLAAGAKAINFVPTSVAGPATDYFGNTRPQGGARDAGAHEYAGTTPPNPPTGLQAIVK